MVKNIWCKKLWRAYYQSKSDVFNNAKLFTEPRYQNYVSLWYILYRIIMIILWMIIVICSIFEIGSMRPRGKNYLWPIYLTNWDLSFGLIQSILGLIVVKKRWNLQKKTNYNIDNLKYDKIVKLYRFFYTVTLTLAIGVTSSYWILVHNPKYHSIDPLNIMIHVCNSLLIICDFIMTNVPLRYRHFWWSIMIVLIYLIFTIIYFIAGGIDKRGKHCIYDAMDWNKPVKTILLASGAIIFLIIVHCLFCYLTIIINKYFNNIKKENNQNINNYSINNNEQITQQVEIV